MPRKTKRTLTAKIAVTERVQGGFYWLGTILLILFMIAICWPEDKPTYQAGMCYTDSSHQSHIMITHRWDSDMWYRLVDERKKEMFSKWGSLNGAPSTDDKPFVLSVAARWPVKIECWEFVDAFAEVVDWLYSDLQWQVSNLKKAPRK